MGCRSSLPGLAWQDSDSSFLRSCSFPRKRTLNDATRFAAKVCEFRDLLLMLARVRDHAELRCAPGLTPHARRNKKPEALESSPKLPAETSPRRHGAQSPARTGDRGATRAGGLARCRHHERQPPGAAGMAVCYDRRD